MDFLKDIKIHLSWNLFLTNERIELLYEIAMAAGYNINPAHDKVLRFLALDLSKIKCVILGQDPYPDSKGLAATGRSFEVGTLKNWTDKFAQHSLKNMVRLIYKSYYGELISYSLIKEKILSGEFDILSPKDWFNDMENQGVLFLNTSHTYERGMPNSHKELWADFSKELIMFISTNNPHVQWFLWGSEAHKSEVNIYSGKAFKSNHPRLYGTETSKDFLNSDCFEKTKFLINWLGQK